MNVADYLIHNLLGDQYVDENKNVWSWSSELQEYILFPAQELEGVTVTANKRTKPVINIIPGNIMSKSKKVNMYLIIALLVAAGIMYYIVKYYKK